MATTLKTTRIYKKVDSTPTYWLYHPQTGGNQVLINSNNVAGGYTTENWMDVDGNVSTSASASYPYTPLEPYLAWMAKQIDNFGNVIEFVGAYSSLTAGLSANQSTIDNAKGEVYINTSSIATAGACSWTQTLNGNPWNISVSPANIYPANTLFVVSGMPATHALVFTPLGGDNSTYATKAQALGTITLSGSTLHVESVDGTTKRSDITFPTIGTVAAGTTSIVSDIPTAADNAIPNVAAVKAYAGSAGRVNAVTATSGYLTVISANTAGTYTVGVVSISVTNGQDATPTLSANITGTAAKANKLVNTLTIAGASGANPLAFDGSNTRNVWFGNGLTVTISSGNISNISVSVDNSKGITLTSGSIGANVTHGISVSSAGIGAVAYQAHGITVNANGIGVNAGDGLDYSSNKVVAKPGNGIAVSANGISATATAGLTVTSSGIGISNSITSGVYSAVAVNQYGLATAGGQAVVFAPNLSAADLGALVVGGVAFIGSGETDNNAQSAATPSGNIS